jgi:REP element-mobilizing transposase RayT
MLSLKMPREYQYIDRPLGYLLSFRAYGTWLHGDKRGSVDRNHNRFGTPRLPPNERWRIYNMRKLKQPPVRLGSQRRAVIEAAVRDVCKVRNWGLWATNVRGNHVHSVVSAPCDPERVLIAIKAKATRMLRQAGFWRSNLSPWARRGSRKYLWTDRDINNAVSYVEYDQGEPLP